MFVYMKIFDQGIVAHQVTNVVHHLTDTISYHWELFLSGNKYINVGRYSCRSWRYQGPSKNNIVLYNCSPNIYFLWILGVVFAHPSMVFVCPLSTVLVVISPFKVKVDSSEKTIFLLVMENDYTYPLTFRRTAFFGMDRHQITPVRIVFCQLSSFSVLWLLCR